ncbi:MAG: isochorismatase family protein [Chloroflexi bacterium]|nr:isochorismatase family protein [Chloroflexota bacterium]
MVQYQITAQNSLFLLVDTQVSLAVAMKKDVYEHVESNIGLLISASKVLGIPVIVTEQYKQGLGLTVETVRKALGDLYQPMEKLSFSCWKDPAIQVALQKSARNYIIIAGIEAHVCVLQTAIDLVSNGYLVHVVDDAVCSRFKNDWIRSLSYLEHAGVTVTTTEILVFQLLQKAGTSEFKEISPLFKNKMR